jgi:sulfide:quinone oxidoreductase
MKIIVLGAGFGGLEIAASLSAEFGSDLDLVLIDKGAGFVFGFSKLDVMFGRELPAAVTHAYDQIDKPGVQFVRAEITAIDPQAKTVTTSAGRFAADILVVALGADLDPSATPGLVEAGHEFYTVAGAFALREVLADFAGGNVIVAVTSTPFKCPPAPSETALLVHDMLRERGLLDTSSVSLVMPMGVPIPPSPEASQALLAEFANRGIVFRGNSLVRALGGERKVAILESGEEIPYDLFLGVPKHTAPQVVVDSGLTTDGWIAVDPRTLETSYPDIYAVGDVTSVGTPKAGVFAEGQAGVVAAEIAARLRGDSTDAAYDGHGICYLEFGQGQIATVDVMFSPGQAPIGTMHGPSTELAQDKDEFGRSRIERWFG